MFQINPQIADAVRRQRFALVVERRPVRIDKVRKAGEAAVRRQPRRARAA